MIAKIPPRRRDGKSSFKKLTNYCLGISGHSKGAVLHVGMKNLNSPPEKAYLEMEGLSYENTRCKNPAFHFILSWRAEESPTNEQVDEAVNIALGELDLQDCQALWALQSDTDNLHVHVAVNRILPESFRAIKPAGGWTKKALERAARKIEITQGWDVEQSGRYSVNVSGQIVERKESDRPKGEISQTARDAEAHTRTESLERQAKREVSKILETAGSWREVHEQLGAKGYSLEKRGNGAVLKCGDRSVKLSHVSRSSSLTKLEQRLGEYRDRPSYVQVQAPQKVTDCRPSWEQYKSEREKYLEAKAVAMKELHDRQKEEREELRRRQQTRRQEIFRESWKGRGRELNQLRSIFAFVQRKERLEQRDRQKDEEREVRAHFLRRFPSFGDWLSAQSREDAYRVYRYPGQLLLSPEQSGIRIPQTQHGMDLRDYSARRGAGSSVLYCKAGTYTADFSDMGRRIVLNKRKLTEESVAAALQLANQKWGATEITGNAEYKELCISAAVKYGLKLANPDLAAEVERRRQAQRQAQRPITAEEISRMKLADKPKIYINPRTDNQQYKGRIVHVDEKRGICVQLVGQHSLIVHRLDRLERPPLPGETVKIAYSDEGQRARIHREEERRRTRSL